MRAPSADETTILRTATCWPFTVAVDKASAKDRNIGAGGIADLRPRQQLALRFPAPLTLNRFLSLSLRLAFIYRGAGRWNKSTGSHLR